MAMMSTSRMNFGRPTLCVWAIALFPALSTTAQTYEVVDVQSVRMEGNPAQWVHKVEAPADPEQVVSR